MAVIAFAFLTTSCGSDAIRYEARNVENGELVRFNDVEGKTFPFDSGQVVTLEKNKELSKWELFTDAKLPSVETKRVFAKVRIERIVVDGEKYEKADASPDVTAQASKTLFQD